MQCSSAVSGRTARLAVFSGDCSLSICNTLLIIIKEYLFPELLWNHCHVSVLLGLQCVILHVNRCSSGGFDGPSESLTDPDPGEELGPRLPSTFYILQQNSPNVFNGHCLLRPAHSLLRPAQVNLTALACFSVCFWCFRVVSRALWLTQVKITRLTSRFCSVPFFKASLPTFSYSNELYWHYLYIIIQYISNE